MKTIKDFLVTEWSQPEMQVAHDKMLKAFQKMDSGEIFNLLCNTFTSDELETLYDEMNASGYL